MGIQSILNQLLYNRAEVNNDLTGLDLVNLRENKNQSDLQAYFLSYKFTYRASLNGLYCSHVHPLVDGNFVLDEDIWRFHISSCCSQFAAARRNA